MAKMGLRKGDFNRDSESDKNKGSSDEIGGRIVWLKSRACGWARGRNVHVGEWTLLEQLQTYKYSWGGKWKLNNQPSKKSNKTKTKNNKNLTSHVFIWDIHMD